jgi:hypothetical protein
MWINNIDIYLTYYIPVIKIVGNTATILSTLIISILILWIINLKRDLDNDTTDKLTENGSNDNDILGMIAPITITFVPFIVCITIGYIAMLVIGYGLVGGNTISQPAGEIYSNITAGQTFISEYGNLNAVDIDFATYSRIPTNDVTFHLKTTPDSNDIATITVEGSKILDNTFYSFKFPSIMDSKGKQYYFSIESP